MSVQKPSSPFRGRLKEPGRSSGTVRWARSRWSRSRQERAEWRKPSRTRPVRPSSAAAIPERRWSSSGSQIAWTISRRAAARRSNCSRASACQAWRCWTMPERRPYIAGNWKMHKLRAEARAYVEEFLPLIEGVDLDVGICVPFTSLDVCIEAAKGSQLKIIAQNMHEEDSGAFTGEISAPMLKDIGVEAVLIGHSERRQFCGETDKGLQRKLPSALAAGLEPILAVGELEDERENGETGRRLRHQVQEAFEDVAAADVPRVVVAYEPVWAIGTGKVATPDQAQEACGFIRALIRDKYGELADQVRIQYGGSVNDDNAHELLALPDIDGALVGGASLDPQKLARIVKAAL